ncbi:hypothetical protein GIB67_024361 [Kingdonia uniflora]|uniref:Uncharacterized protein n=1 Tax=Kingdonia uniflora TaxID=39325 RepID=A0A7J7LF69_9MAGN|nr:hypothetical protein GIB67_024361 [Kingdonia uniflora]
MGIVEETEDTSMDQVNEIGYKIATGGWFVSERESILLAHDDGSCSFYDIANTKVAWEEAWVKVSALELD